MYTPDPRSHAAARIAALIAVIGLAAAVAAEPGPPVIDGAGDQGGGSAAVTWTNLADPPLQHLGFAWDLYSGTWVAGGAGGGLFYPFETGRTSGVMNVGYAGGYHFYMSNLYDGDPFFFPSAVPVSTILYAGTPHPPADFRAMAIGGRQVRLTWRTDWFGAWHYQILGYHITSGSYFVSEALDGSDYWHYAFWGDGPFSQGSIDLTLPFGGEFWFYIRAVGWDAASTSEFRAAYIIVRNVDDMAGYLGRYNGSIPVTGDYGGDSIFEAKGTLTARLDLLEFQQDAPNVFHANGQLRLTGSLRIENEFTGLTVDTLRIDESFDIDADGTNPLVVNAQTLVPTFAYEDESILARVESTGSLPDGQMVGVLLFEGLGAEVEGPFTLNRE